jgi:hypothetical protein
MQEFHSLSISGAFHGFLKNEVPYGQRLNPYRGTGNSSTRSAIWIICRLLIGLALRIVGRGMSQQKTDPTVIRYVQSAVGAVLNIVLVIAILNFFGLETTSLAALIAAGGGAIGLAWSGSLANFAAAVFMVILPGVARSSATSSRPSPTIRSDGLICRSSSITPRTFIRSSRCSRPTGRRSAS